MTVDIDSYNVWLVRVDTEYLVAVAYEDTKMCRWSRSPFDALQIKDLNSALEIAKAAKGTVVRFNTITGVIS